MNSIIKRQPNLKTDKGSEQTLLKTDKQLADKHTKICSTSLVIKRNRDQNRKEIPLHTHYHGYKQKDRKSQVLVKIWRDLHCY